MRGALAKKLKRPLLGRGCAIKPSDEFSPSEVARGEHVKGAFKRHRSPILSNDIAHRAGHRHIDPHMHPHLAILSVRVAWLMVVLMEGYVSFLI